MSIRIALAGNPNSGKTTLFNALTGAQQYVGNWPGVTVERKEGRIKGNKDVILQDLPGVYSLSPYTQEEVITRRYLVEDRPDAIINIVDGSNIERNLYLTTQLLELGIPLVVAVNMIDVVRKSGDTIDLGKLSSALGVPVLSISALKGEGLEEIMAAAIQAANTRTLPRLPHVFDGAVEHTLAHIEEAVNHRHHGSLHHHHADGSQHEGALTDEHLKRWYAIKLFERDTKATEGLRLRTEDLDAIEEEVALCEVHLDDDAESIITNQRYAYIQRLMEVSVVKKRKAGALSVSDRIDRVVTNRVLGFPIFIAVMFLVYYISVTTVGTWVTDFTNEQLFSDGFFLLGRGRTAYDAAVEEHELAAQKVEAYLAAAGLQELDPAASDFAEHAKNLTAQVEVKGEEGEKARTLTVTLADYMAAKAIKEPDAARFGPFVPGIPHLVEGWLDGMNTSPWLKGLAVEGIIGGVGAVLGFVPQMFVLFFFLAILEDIGYMARVAFIMDRIFRKFGLSGKSFIPMLIGSGCSVPGIMASRTIENQRDRRMTIITTSFIPCGAKLPIVALIAGAIMGNVWWVGPLAYFIGVAAVIISGIILKKTRLFMGEPAPFVMELPSYHSPAMGNVLRSMWERGFSFIKRAGTIILLFAIVIWFMKSYGVVNGRLLMVEDMDHSILAWLGGLLAPLFVPLGFGNWQNTVATVLGLVAKEEVVSVFGVLYGVGEGALDLVEAGAFADLAPIAAHFTQLSALSFLAFNLLCAPCFAAIGAMHRELNNTKWTVFAVGFQTALAYTVSLIIYQLGVLPQGGFTAGTAVAILLLLILAYMLFRKPHRVKLASAQA